MEMQKKQYISEEFDEKLTRSRCRTGDVLVAIVGATLGRIGFIERDEQQGNINQNITKITISDLRFSPKFVAVFWTQNWVKFSFTDYQPKQHNRI